MRLLLSALLAAGALWAQGPQPNPPQGNPMNAPWWRTPQAERVGLNPDQRKKLDDLWQQHRLRRIDLEASLQKAQVTLEPLWQNDSPDEGKILAQMDRVLQAQGEVRKDEARMQLGMRQILSPDQWRRVQEQMRPNGPPPPQNQPRPPQQPQR